MLTGRPFDLSPPTLGDRGRDGPLTSERCLFGRRLGGRDQLERSGRSSYERQSVSDGRSLDPSQYGPESLS